MYERVLQYCCCCEGGDCCEGGGLDSRTAIEGSYSAWGGLGKPNRGRDRGETDSGSGRGSDRDSDVTFQISRNLGLEHVEFVCLLDSQLCTHDGASTQFSTNSQETDNSARHLPAVKKSGTCKTTYSLSSRTNHVGVTTMKRLDQGHLPPKLEILRLTWPGQELNPGLCVGSLAL